MPLGHEWSRPIPVEWEGSSDSLIANTLNSNTWKQTSSHCNLWNSTVTWANLGTPRIGHATAFCNRYGFPILFKGSSIECICNSWITSICILNYNKIKNFFPIILESAEGNILILGDAIFFFYKHGQICFFFFFIHLKLYLTSGYNKFWNHLKWFFMLTSRQKMNCGSNYFYMDTAHFLKNLRSQDHEYLWQKCTYIRRQEKSASFLLSYFDWH